MLGLIAAAHLHLQHYTFAGNPEGFTSEHLITLLQWHKLPFDEYTFRASTMDGKALLRGDVTAETSSHIGIAPLHFIVLMKALKDMKHTFDNQGPRRA